MRNYKTTIEFIHLCRDFAGETRLTKIAGNLGVPLREIQKHAPQIGKVVDFVKYVDGEYHTFYPDGEEHETFLGDTFHSHIASDLRSIAVLVLAGHDYQANIVLRHLLESFVMTFWGDLGSNFKGSWNYILDTKQWKPYRSRQRITWDFDKRFPNRSIRERLERIRLINFINKNGKAFYSDYFAKASYCDLILLLSLPICSDCMKKSKGQVNYQEFHLDPKIRKTGKEDKHAVFRTDFGFSCTFCGMQKISGGFANGIPEPSDMLDMLVAISDDNLAVHLRKLQRAYGYLSEEYVHFSTTHHPDSKPPACDIAGEKSTFWGFEGTLFCLKLLEPLMKYYFVRLTKVRRR